MLAGYILQQHGSEVAFGFTGAGGGGRVRGSRKDGDRPPKSSKP